MHPELSIDETTDRIITAPLFSVIKDLMPQLLASGMPND
jgi:hypothetical protein